MTILKCLIRKTVQSYFENKKKCRKKLKKKLSKQFFLEIASAQPLDQTKLKTFPSNLQTIHRRRFTRLHNLFIALQTRLS